METLLSITATFLAWLLPEERHVLRRWLRLSPQQRSRESTAESQSVSSTTPETVTAGDFISLGEHLWYLSNSVDQPPQAIERSIGEFRSKLEHCGLPRTRASATCLDSTTIGRLQSQMKTIGSALYAEVSAAQASFVKLGEFVWYLSNPKMATTAAINGGIIGFLEKLDECNLLTREVARPLENFQYDYFCRSNLVAGTSLDQLATLMQPIRDHLFSEACGVPIASR